jgi:hypothetical protein
MSALTVHVCVDGSKASLVWSMVPFWPPPTRYTSPPGIEASDAFVRSGSDGIVAHESVPGS